MNATGATRHIPSVSEVQAVVEALRAGTFATPTTTPRVAAAPPSTPDVATPPAAALAAPAPPGPTPAHAPTPPGPEPATPRSGGTGLWLLGTHGGSGARCLATVLPGTCHAGKTWPATPPSTTGREPVVLVCRSSHRGLSSAQDYARAYRDSGPDGIAGHLQLVGVIICADAPGRTPSALRRLEKLLSGAVPIIGHAPWEPTWRLGPPVVAEDLEPLPWVTKLARTVDETLAGGVARAGVPA